MTSKTLRLGRGLAITVLLALCGAHPAPASAAVTLANWDASAQRQVVRAGLMNNIGRSFQGASPITSAQVNTAMVALATRLQGTTGSVNVNVARTAHDPVTVVGFDQLLVRELGLSAVAAQVQGVAAAAGLHPPSYFGSEVVTRYLGLRFNHPSGTDQLELFPSDPITRAEAAWSLGQVMNFGSWSVSSAQQALSAFQLPVLSGGQRQVLQIAASRIGYPYVWGGTTDDTSDGLAHGGFDCSGFAWRVYKVSGLSWGQAIRGRTAAQQAAEIPKRRRLRMSQLQPGDLLFFGSAHFNSKATESTIDHEGIYLGDNWVIHSSSQGVYVLPLQGSWLGDTFAWGRRVLS
jgi:cell wall-associated NlpC family hydrolase